MSINVSIGYGASYVTVRPEVLAIREQGDLVVVDADNAACSETVSVIINRGQAATLLTMLQSLLGKAT